MAADPHHLRDTHLVQSASKTRSRPDASANQISNNLATLVGIGRRLNLEPPVSIEGCGGVVGDSVPDHAGTWSKMGDKITVLTPAGTNFQPADQLILSPSKNSLFAPWPGGLEGAVGSSRTSESLRRVGALTLSAPLSTFEEAVKQHHLYYQTMRINVGPYSVPIALQHIAERITRSRSMLDSGHDERSDHSDTYLERTWQRAAQFVLKASTSFWTGRHAMPPTPVMSAGPDGSIDVVWRLRNRALYMNVPEEPVNVVTFFGRDHENAALRLRVEEDAEEDGEWILGWLAR